MPDLQTLGPDESTPSQGVDPTWISGLQNYLDGKPTSYDPKQGVPPGYKIDNGKVVQSNAWDQWGKGAVEFFGPAALTAFAPGLPAALGGPSSATESTGSMSVLDDVFRGINTGSKLISPLADILGSAAKSTQQQNNAADQLKLALQSNKTNQLRTALSAPGTRLSTALQAALAKTATPGKVNWGGPGSGLRGEVPTFTGGSKSIYDALKDPNVSQLSDQITKDELLGQMNGGPSGGNQDLSAGTAANVGQSTTGDDVLGGLGLSTSLLAALNKSGVLNPKAPASGDTNPTFQTYGPNDPNFDPAGPS